MAKEISVEEAVQRAQRLQDSRIDAIRELAEARASSARAQNESAQRVEAVQREHAEIVAEGERRDVQTFNAAIAAGWSVEELRKVGYPEPEKKVRARKKPARKTAKPTATTAPTPAPSGESVEEMNDSIS